MLTIRFKSDNLDKKPHITSFHTNNLYKKPSHTNNSHKNHHTNLQTNIIIMIIDISVVINQINKHKAKMYDQCAYTSNYY